MKLLENLKVSVSSEKTIFFKSIFKPCVRYPLRYFSVSENHAKDGGTVSRRNGKHLNQMKMLKLSKRELNILKIISKRIRCLENNLFFILFYYFNSSAMIINFANPIFIVMILHLFSAPEVLINLLLH